MGVPLISTHAPLAGRDTDTEADESDDDISTHAPLAGRDRRLTPQCSALLISTHAPLAGRDLRRSRFAGTSGYFNPRAPCGTEARSGIAASKADFNPRAPCGARPDDAEQRARAPVFQPTRPLRGATGYYSHPDSMPLISTHAPLAGRDIAIVKFFNLYRYFNPRAPCGARPLVLDGALIEHCISTHAPLAGRDRRRLHFGRIRKNFNPRAPCGARPGNAGRTRRAGSHFNPRAPCGARRWAGFRRLRD